MCALCRFDAHGFYKQLAALPTEQARLQLLMAHQHQRLLGGCKRSVLTDPKEGDFWEADHIVPVAEGGGESDLTNYQTLCVPCHAKKTKQQSDAKERRKRQERTQQRHHKTQHQKSMPQK